MPDEYEPDTITGRDVVQVFRDVHRCGKIAVDGKDVGGGSVIMLFVPVETPFGFEPDPNVFDWFLIETLTENGGFSSWLSAQGIKAGAGVTEFDYVPDTGLPTQSASMRVLQENRTVSEMRGKVGTGTFEENYQFRFFYGPDPKTDHWAVEHAYIHGNVGAAQTTTAPDTTLADLAGGITTLPSYPMTLNSTFLRLVAPADRVQ